MAKMTNQEPNIILLLFYTGLGITEAAVAFRSSVNLPSSQPKFPEKTI